MRTGDDGDDDLVALEWDDGEEPAGTPGDAWRRRITPLAVLAVVGLLAVAASVAGSGDGRQGEDAAGDASPTTTSTTGTTVRGRSIGEDPEPATTTTTMPFVSEPTGGRRLVFLDRGKLVIVELDANRLVTRVLPFSGNVRRFDTNRTSIVVTGRDVFLSDGSQALRLSTELRPEEEPRVVGQSLATFASARAGRVWLTQPLDDAFVVVEVDGSGHVTTGPKRLPADTVPVAAAGTAGLVLTRGGDILVWDPVKDAVRWQSPANAGFLGVAGENVIWQRYCDGAICSFHVTNAATHADRTYPLDGQLWFAYNGRIAFGARPDGRFAAASLTPNDVGRGSELMLVDVRSGARFSVPTVQPGTPVWSPDGEWVFLFGGTDGPEQLHASGAVRVGRVEDGRLRLVTMQVPREARGTAAAVL